MDMNLVNWHRDGAGSIERLGDGEFEVRIETPFTLWHPGGIESPFFISFDVHVLTAETAMLLMACARNWRGRPLLETERTGSYDDYNCGDMELYTVGFNRTGHVSSDVQPNASTANIRRIGGPDFTGYTSDAIRLGRDDANMDLWRRWDEHSLLASAREFASGTARYFHYEVRFSVPRITFCLEGRELVSVIDHRPDPLDGGVFGLRCMTPGGRYRVKNIAAGSLIAGDV